MLKFALGVKAVERTADRTPKNMPGIPSAFTPDIVIRNPFHRPPFTMKSSDLPVFDSLGRITSLTSPTPGRMERFGQGARGGHCG
jgi:hypothetical protein